MLVINRLFFFLDVIFSLVPRGYGDLILVMVFTGFVAKFFCCSSLSANHFPYGFPPFFLYFVKIYAISLLIILTFKQRHFLPAGLSPCTFSRDTIQMVFSPGGCRSRRMQCEQCLQETLLPRQPLCCHACGEGTIAVCQTLPDPP